MSERLEFWKTGNFKKDVAEIEEEVKEGIDIKFVTSAEDVWKDASER